MTFMSTYTYYFSIDHTCPDPFVKGEHDADLLALIETVRSGLEALEVDSVAVTGPVQVAEKTMVMAQTDIYVI